MWREIYDNNNNNRFLQEDEDEDQTFHCHDDAGYNDVNQVSENVDIEFLLRSSVAVSSNTHS
jgi:hypothetical protein